MTLSGHITGVGALTKTVPDELILSGASTYDGPTSVNQGTLSVNGSVVSDVTVANGGTLGRYGAALGASPSPVAAPMRQATPSAPRQ